MAEAKKGLPTISPGKGKEKYPVEVKSRGKVLGTIDIMKFVDPKVMMSDPPNGMGVTNIMTVINQVMKEDAMNSFRAGQTRTGSPLRRLMAISKTDPKVKAKLDALLAEITPAEEGKTETSKK